MFAGPRGSFALGDQVVVVERGIIHWEGGIACPLLMEYCEVLLTVATWQYVLCIAHASMVGPICTLLMVASDGSCFCCWGIALFPACQLWARHCPFRGN